MSDITLQSDHAGVALGKFAEQFKNKANLAALMNIFTKQVQRVEQALYDLYTLRWISTATGAQLDVLGKIVGQPRDNSANDDEYRVRIQARILTNKSDGTMRAIYRIFAVLLPGTHVLFQPGYPAGFEFFIDKVLTPTYAQLYASFLRAAHAAGVWGNLRWYPVADPLMFFTESVITYTPFVTQTSGTTSLRARDATYAGTAGAFPSTGSIEIDAGTPNAETIAYTAVGPGLSGELTFTLSTPTAHGHTAGTTIALVGTPGLGFEGGPQGFTKSAHVAVPGDSALVLFDGSITGTLFGTFPASGSIIVDDGTPAREVLTYTSITPGSGSLIFNLAAPYVQQTHTAFATVTLNTNDGGQLAGEIAV